MFYAHLTHVVIFFVMKDAAEGEVEMRLTCVLPVIESRFRGDKTTHFTERLWAYLTIKKLLDDMKELTNNTEKENAKSRAMELSLKVSHTIKCLHGSQSINQSIKQSINQSMIKLNE